MTRLIFLFLLSLCLAIIARGSSSAFETSASSSDVVPIGTVKFLSFLPMPTIASDSAFFMNSLFEDDKPALDPQISPTPILDFCMHVPVLLYHHTQPLDIARLLGHAQLTVDSNIFDEQMKYLKENDYNIISAEALVSVLLKGQKLSEKTVVITIDDGYDDNYTYAFSTAKKYEVVINFMIPTDFIGNPGYMTWEHLKEMRDSPYARIYNHTASHAALGYLSSEQIEWELKTSSEALKNNIGLSNTIFTYPYGSYNDLVIEILKNHGFSGAYSTIEGKTQCKSQVMLLQRMHIGNAPLLFYGF